MFLAACVEPITSVPDEPPGGPGPLASLSSSCSPTAFAQFIADPWVCGQPVRFYTNVSSLIIPLQASVDEWRFRLESTGFSELPSFLTIDEVELAQATVTGTGMGTTFCGEWLPGTRVIQVRTGCAIQESRGPLHNLLLHELGHAIGFNGGNTHKFFRTPVAEHCVTHLPEDKTINGAVCVHEVEAVLAGYGLVQYSVTDSSFAHTPFVTNSALPLQSATLEIGQTTTLTPGALALELGGVVSGTENAYTWSTSAIGVASVSTTGVVTAASAGTATIRATPTHGTGYFLAHPFRTTGRTATITVQGPPPPPPPPPFQVDSIGTDQMPITLATHHLFSARVLSPPSGSLSTVWIITDSRTPTVSDTVTVSGNTLSRFVEAGSYTLSFTVRPTVGSTSGFAASQGIPVCAAPSTDLWGGGGSTEATPGCEEYQQ